MNTRLIEGTRVLMPATSEELREAVARGEPFHAPTQLAREFGLPEDPHLIAGEDVGVLDSEEDAA